MRRSAPLAPLPLALLVGCATTAEPEPKAPPVEARRPVETKPRRLCEVMADIDDARYRGSVEKVRRELTAASGKSSKDRALAFGALYSVEKDNDRWKAFRADLEMHPDSVVGPLGECLVYSAWKMPDQATGPCAEAEKRLPGLALVDVARADLAFRRDRHDDALERLEAAIATDAGCAPAHALKAQVLAQRGDVAGAIGAWEAALAAHPRCFRCAAEKAAIIERTEGVDAALPHWEAALSLAPDHGPTLQRYAATLVGRDDERALAAYEKALALGREDEQTLMAAARLARTTGQAEKALDYAEKVAAKQPDDVDIWRFLADLYEERGERGGLEKAYSELLRLVPDDAVAHLALARAGREAGRYVDALKHYEAALATLPATGDDAGRRADAEKELKGLLAELLVEEPGVSGTAERVVTQVQRKVRRVYEDQVRTRPGLRGRLDVTVITRADGGVSEVNIRRDTLNDAKVAAALVGHLTRASISGGARRYNFELEFE